VRGLLKNCLTVLRRAESIFPLNSRIGLLLVDSLKPPGDILRTHAVCREGLIMTAGFKVCLGLSKAVERLL
jgi:hypothetical protein